MLTFDAVVIGSGPAGLNASLYLVRAGLRTALIEKNSSGGQVLSTSEIENYLGFPKGVKGWELADLFTAHVNEYDVEHIRGEVLKIETIEENGAMHVLHMQNGDQIKTRAVIIATGASSRPLGVPEEETYKGKGVSYCALCDGNFYRGLDVAIVGGGNSALEEALYLSRIVNKIYIIHRREGFRGAQIYLDKIRAVPEKIELVTSCVVDSLAGEPTLKKVIVRHVETNEKRELPVEGIFVYIGHVSNARFVPENLERNEQGFILTDQEMQTNIPGIFAAGDVVEGSWQLAHTGMEEGRRVAGYLAGILPGKPAAVVRCLYMDPEVASVGMTEAEAAAQGIDAVSAKQNLYANARTRIATSERGFMKVVADRGSHKILGAQLMGERAGDIVAELALAVNCGLSVEELLASTRPHPSYCEAITDVLQTLRGKFNGI